MSPASIARTVMENLAAGILAGLMFVFVLVAVPLIAGVAEALYNIFWVGCLR